MAKPYSEDLRRRAVDTVADGATIPEAAEQCGISISSVGRFVKLHRDTGGVSSAKFGGYKGFVLAEHEELVRQLVVNQPDITLAELAARLAKKKVTVGKSSVSRFLHHLKLTFKKKVCGRRSRIARTSPPNVGRCNGDSQNSIRDGSFSSMKPPFPRRSCVSTAGHPGMNGSCKRSCMETGKQLLS
jgi:transposase